MNTTLRIDAAGGAEGTNQVPTITSGLIKAKQSTAEAITSAMIEAEQSTTEAISSWLQSSLRLAPMILQGLIGVFAVLYLLGVCAVAAGLLFYTFS
jgi:hypothetical protein